MADTSKDFTVSTTLSINIGGIAVGSSLKTDTKCDSNDGFSHIIPANTTAGVVSFAGTVATMVAAGIDADQDCTVKTYNTNTLVDTLVIKKNQPQVWRTGDSQALFFTGNFTQVKIDTGGTATQVRMAIGMNKSTV